MEKKQKKLQMKTKEKVKKQERGVTLIALVVTIIVLLILAAAAIATLTGDNGIFANAVKAREENNKQGAKEEIEMVLADLNARYRIADAEGNPSRVELIDYIFENENAFHEQLESEVTVNGAAGMVKYKGYIFHITDEGKVEIVGIDELDLELTGQAYNARHPELHIPTGFRYKTGTVDTGYVIKDAEGNEFVWIPVASPADYAKKMGSANWNLTDSGVAANLEDNLLGDNLGTATILGTAVTATTTKPAPEAEIVNAAGGFWVGRYEAGVEVNGQINWSSNPAIVVKEGAQPARQITQNTSLSKANSWKSGEADVNKKTVAFQSGLITGTQWDVMCNFIGWSTANSQATTWGNYWNVKSSTYTGYHSSDCSNDWKYEIDIQKTGINSQRWVFPSGKFIPENGTSTAQKNIYDVAGNVWEWTTEVPVRNSGNNRVVRGGSANYDTGTLATIRSGYSFAGDAYWDIGFRLVLYVK